MDQLEGTLAFSNRHADVHQSRTCAMTPKIHPGNQDSLNQGRSSTLMSKSRGTQSLGVDNTRMAGYARNETDSAAMPRCRLVVNS